MSHVTRITDADFEKHVLECDLPVLVEFWGSWCPPCKMMEPVLEDLAGEYQGEVRVCKLNTDQNPRSTARYGVQGVPTCVVFWAGEPRERRVGAASKGQLVQMVRHVLEGEG